MNRQSIKNALAALGVTLIGAGVIWGFVTGLVTLLSCLRGYQ